MVFKSLTAAAFFQLALVFTANAAVVYSYSGNNFTSAATPYTTDMNITLELVTASPLAASGSMVNVTSQILSYAVFDGVTTLTDADSAISVFVNIDAATGLPGEWAINATNEFGIGLNDIANRMDTLYNSFSGGVDRAEELECAAVTGVGECIGFIPLAGALVNNAPGDAGSWSVVPVPAAIWLFGSGLIGLIAFSRYKR